MKRPERFPLAEEICRGLWEEPQLRHLYLEPGTAASALTAEQYGRFLRELKADFGTAQVFLCVRGDPALREDLPQIMGEAHALGFSWGMTGAVHITEGAARLLQGCGLSAVSLDIDSMAECSRLAVAEAFLRIGGIRNIRVCTAVNPQSLGALEGLYQNLRGLDIDCWQLTAPQEPLTAEDYRRLLCFLRRMRRAGEPVHYSCGAPAGRFIPCIRENGDILLSPGAAVQGNILRDRFREVWERGFLHFRREFCRSGEGCRICPERDVQRCTGGRPVLCFREVQY